MTTGNTTLLGLALPVEGELDGTWGDVVNNSITSLLDSAVAGTTTLSADADVTLTTTVLADNEARQAIILWTASNGATTRNITAPAQSKQYIVINAGTGSVVLRGAGPTTGITIAVGEKCLAAWNSTDFVKIATSLADGVSTISFGTTGLTPATATSGDVTVAGTLAAANGGTAQSTYTTGDLIYASASNTLSKRAVGTAGQVLTVAGGVPTWAAAVTGLPSQAGNAGKYLTTNGTDPSWTNTGAAAGGGIYVNNNVISQNYTIATGQNGFSVGPMTVASGYAVTVSSGQRWVIL